MSLPSEQNWLVLNHLIKDLTSKGYEIPDGINPEMGIIRSSISSYKRDPSRNVFKQYSRNSFGNR